MKEHRIDEPKNSEKIEKIINSFQREFNLNQKDVSNIVESLRRHEFLKANNKFMLLSCPSRVSKNHYKASYSELPRVSNWYELTEEGRGLMCRLLSDLRDLIFTCDRANFNHYLFVRTNGYERNLMTNKYNF
ncbi:MAG TPA: hypothetical protein VMV36_01560 [Ignavibacteriaceae bacterium]|nr:hypothetical protein [Ignavibacteriaceae bacterium]